MSGFMAILFALVGGRTDSSIGRSSRLLPCSLEGVVVAVAAQPICYGGRCLFLVGISWIRSWRRDLQGLLTEAWISGLGL